MSHHRGKPIRVLVSSLSSFVVLFVVASALAPPATHAATTDWPHFRGPNQNGSSSGGVFDDGGFGLEVVWERALGSGYSGISIVDDRAVTLSTDGEVDFVTAFETATGRELWRYELAPMYQGHGGSHDGPISTPTIHDGMVYVLGPRGQLVALELASGRLVWRRELTEEPEAREPTWGYATTPLVVGESLVVLTGGANGHAVTAFRRRDGEPLWHTGSDTVGYQSPVLAELLGRRQIVAAFDNELLGLEPRSGEPLWSHRYGEGQTEGFGQPLVLDGRRILLTTFEEAILFNAAPAGDGARITEAWRSRHLRGSHALPVHARGHLFGFNHRFLTCLDPATGEVVWRSRPPGGRGLILVDEHLVLTSFEGDLVVAEASPEEYRERARIPLLETQSYTTPSFAAGDLFVRDLSRLARVRIGERSTAPGVTRGADPELEIPAGPFGDRIRAVLAASDRRVAVDRLMQEAGPFPIVEESGWAHFVYRGDVDDIALQGTMLGGEEERVLQRIPGTDLHFVSLELDADGYWEYRFTIFGDLVTDPLNPHTIGSSNGDYSELRMPGWPVPEHLAEPTGPRGRLETVTLRSTATDSEREIQVYLPADYDGGSARYPLVLYHNGSSHQTFAHLDWSLDNLMGDEVAPAIVVLLPRVGQDFGGATTDAYVTMLVDELLPHLDRTYRTLTDPQTRTVMGAGSGGYVSAYAAFTRPGLFGKLATQSLYNNAVTVEALRAGVEGEKQDLDVYVEWSRHDHLYEDIGIDAARDSRELAELLEAKGYPVRRNVVTGAAGWGSWRAQLDDILGAFYPLAE